LTESQSRRVRFGQSTHAKKGLPLIDKTANPILLSSEKGNKDISEDEEEGAGGESPSKKVIKMKEIRFNGPEPHSLLHSLSSNASPRILLHF
jgi:hypothetical protein